MPFQLSAGQNISEIDLTTIAPSVASSDGALAGVFPWGPVGELVHVDSESTLVQRFLKPSNFNAETFFTGANYLSYSTSLYVARAANTSGATPAVSVTTTTGSAVVTASNTTGVVVGMYVTQSGNTSLVGAGNNVTVSAVNATAITLSSNAVGTGTGTLYFGNPGTAYSAVALASPTAIVQNLVNQIVKNENAYTNLDGNFDSDVLYVAKFPGAPGNSLRVSVVDNAESYSSNIAVSANIQFSLGSNVATCTFLNTSNTDASATQNEIAIGDQILAGNSSIGYQYLTVTNTSVSTANGNTLLSINFQDPYRLHTAYTSGTIQRYWEFFNVVGQAPGQSAYVAAQGNTAASDEMHVVVVDDGGVFTGVPGTVLEVFKGVSRATDAKNIDGSTNYYKTVINQDSQYLWWANDRAGAGSANAANIATSTTTAPLDVTLTLGNNGYDEASAPLSIIASAYDLFGNKEDIDISLIMQGRPISGTTNVNGMAVSNFQLANYLIDNIAGERKDVVVFVSPDKSTVLNNLGNEAISLINWRGAVHDSSYAVMDSGYKYQYDRYNDIYRWIPLNGDIAGLCARTDQTNDAWWSPAGFNRGQIKNLVKLAYNPNHADRDLIYPHGINPVVTFPGRGTVLYGDKTLQSKPSAFDRINVRRLFIVLEKSISKAADYSLFEFNDPFTRAQFRNLVTPFLRTVQGRRGITDFLVVCDDTNNTAQIIDANQFVGDIYIKPARSINFIQLNFVAVGTGVQFSQVVSQF